MALLSTHLRRRVVAATATIGVLAPMASVELAHADTTAPTVVFHTPIDGQTARTTNGVHLLLGTSAGVNSVQLSYSTNDGATWTTIASSLSPSATGIVETTWKPGISGKVDIRATASLADGGTSEDVVDNLNLSATSGTVFSDSDEDVRKGLLGPFIKPRRQANGDVDPIGVFRRADGHAFTRVSGKTSGVEPHADAPSVTPVVVPPSSLPAPTGQIEPKDDIFREPVDLTGNPGLTTGRAVIRVNDNTSSEAVEAPLYNQTVRSVATSRNGSTVTATVSDQNGQPVVGAPVHLRGFVNGSPTPVSQVAVSDAYNGQATFTIQGDGFYVPYVDLNLNGFQSAGEPVGQQIVVGTVTRSAPGRALYHDNRRTKGGGGTVGDSLRGTRAAAARHYQWIDQNGQLSYTTRAVMRAGASRVTVPSHLTWVNAHGAPYNPRWLKRGRFETRAWSTIRRRPGLRNADMTFQQNAAYGLSVEWEVKDIRPFTKPAALNAAFASLAASAQRYYGAAWQSRVQIKVLSNLSGGLPFALKVLRYAHAHGFTTMLLARGAATRTQIPASAHQYVTYVRGASSALYPTP